jgi:outer membrane protein insertion porin family
LLFLLTLILTASAAPAAEESDRPLVGKIVVSGNDSFSDGRLKSLMRTREPRIIQFSGHPRYLRDWLRGDLATLEAFYHRAGFYEVVISSLAEGDIIYDPELGSVEIHLRIDEGKRRFLREVHFEPPLGELERGLRRELGLQPGRPFDPQAPGMDQFRILRALQKEGYFAGRVRHELEILPTPGHAARDSAVITYEVERGPRARLKEMSLQGNRLSDSLIKRELSCRVGELLRLEQLLDSKQNLLDSGYFRGVDYRLESLGEAMGPTGREELLRLVWIFRERKLATVETGVGLGSVDGLRLLGGWSHRNLLDRGQRVSLQGNLSFKDDRDGNFGLNFERESLDWRFLHIARLRANLGLLLFREKDYELETQSFSLETRAIRFTASRRVDQDTILKLRQQFDFLYQRSIGDVPVEVEPRFNTRSLSLVLDRDSRDFFFNPREGGHSWLSYEVAGGIQGGDHHFQRLQLNATRHRRSPRNGVFASRIYLGGVWPYGQSRNSDKTGVPADGVPFEERFYCGGGSTVRGYDENSLGPHIGEGNEDLSPELPGQNLPETILGGRFMAVANLEWRFPLHLFGQKALGGVLFFDAGGAWEDLDDIAGTRALPWQPGDEEDTRRVFYGLGTGLRYLTPLTVFRIDFGLPLQTLSSNHGRWHFSLGHTF